MRTRKWVVRGVGVLALLAAMTACSSSSSKGATNSSATTVAGGPAPSAGSPTGSPITVGDICDCSGPYGPNQTATDEVARAWVKSVNASGGLEGHPIDLKFFDDASNPGVSATEAQTLISDHVAVIIDNSNFDATWASAVAAAKIPVVGAQYSSVPFYTNPNFYPTGTTTDASAYSLVQIAKLAGAANVGMDYCAEVASCAQMVSLIRTAGEQLGVPLVYSASISATAPNYTAQCVAAQQAKVKALFVGEAEAIVARVAEDCDRQGYDPIYLSPGITFTLSLPTTPGVRKLWLSLADMPIWSDAPEVQAMNSAVDKYYPGLRSGHGAIWSQYAVGGWTAGLLIRDAVKGSGVGSGTVTAATMTQGLDSIKNDTLDGWAPPLTFTAGQPHPVDCWFTAKWINGHPSMLNNGQVSCKGGSTPSH